MSCRGASSECHQVCHTVEKRVGWEWYPLVLQCVPGTGTDRCTCTCIVVKFISYLYLYQLMYFICIFFFKYIVEKCTLIPGTTCI